VIETLAALTRVALARALGRPYNPSNLRTLIKTALEDLEVFGGPPPPLGARSPLSPEEAAAINLLGLRRTVRRTVTQVPFYRDRLGADAWKGLTRESYATVPLTFKEDLRRHGAAFFAEGTSDICLYQPTSGTSGHRADLYLSQPEVLTLAKQQALTWLLEGQVAPDDVVQVHLPASAQPDLYAIQHSLTLIGAAAVMPGVIHPAEALAALAEARSIPGKRSKTSVLVGYTSYLLLLVRWARVLGYGPDDFEVRRVQPLGETLSSRAQQTLEGFFRAEIFAGYGASEISPASALRCPRGNYHFDEGTVYIEVVDPASKSLVEDGEVGTAVITPLYPTRSAMPVLRYYTGDLVRRFERCGCGRSENGGVYALLGRELQAFRYHGRLFTPLEVTETLERVPEVYFPARYGVSREDADSAPVRLAVQVEPEAAGEPARVGPAVLEALRTLGIEDVELTLHASPRFGHAPHRWENEIALRRSQHEGLAGVLDAWCTAAPACREGGRTGDGDALVTDRSVCHSPGSVG